MRPSVTSDIGDYAIIGDCRSAGLISRDGSLDWLCLPRFDSPSVFGAILDPERGGRFAISVACDEVRRTYVGASNVLETTFRGAGGEVRLLDLVPVQDESDKARRLSPDHEVLRRLECRAGAVEVEVLCDPRPNYGATRPRLRRKPWGTEWEWDNGVLVLRSDVALEPLPGETSVRGTFTLHAGDTATFSLVYAHGEPAVLPILGASAEGRIRRSIEWWEAWAARIRYPGRYFDAVLRSALTLKLMSYAPSGAIIAAPTTSLPEWPGGTRNWDYRYCWLRDASMTLRAFFDLGVSDEGEAFLDWILHATRLSWPELQVLYDVYGETRIPERELDHLDGFRHSRPVRIGNAASSQFQLDIYGKVVDAAFVHVERGGRLGREARRMLAGLGTTVCRRWREPDEGIWEIRSTPRHHTLSKAMCWVALDRLIRMRDAGHLELDPAPLERERDMIRAEVESRGVDPHTGSYVVAFGDHAVDASLLLLPLYGYTRADSPRMATTIHRIRTELGVGPLIYRNRGIDDGLPPGEGAFGICGFWAVACLARAGRVDEAESVFEELLRYGNDVGLYAEQVDVESGRALGNFPQAYTHVGLIDAAMAISQAKGELRPEAERGPIQFPGAGP